jgi:signal transduction histidine kinase
MPARAPEVANPAPVSGIGAIVERIEAFRRAREASGVVDESIAASGGLPQLPLGDTIARPAAPLTTVDFATDAGGRISWCERGAAPMLVGRNLAAIESLRLAIRQRLPIRATPITLAGAPAISGDWQADAMPQFDAQGGRFTGYLGRLRRTSVAAAAEETPSIAMREADGLRQVLHELRTPVNAIQGFAEIIQHQLYGPTPHEYRALSAVIVADAARILAGFEELERLARLGSGAIQPAQGECDFAEIARTAAGRMAPQAQARMLDLSFHGGDAPLPVALATIEAERLCWRLLTALAGCADAGEALDFELEPCGPMMSFTLTLPKRLATLDDRTLFSGDATLAADAGGAATVGMFGSGFALRLARVEAQAAGGNLIRNKEKLNLSLPLLTRMAMAHSHSGLGGLDRMGTPVA